MADTIVLDLPAAAEDGELRGLLRSGAAVALQMAHVLTFRDGLAVRLRQYLDRAEALAAAGLPERDAHADA